MKKVLLSLMILIVCSCKVSSGELAGVYLYKDSYIVDSLIINKDFTYRRSIYAFDKKRKLYNNVNIWRYDNNMIELKKFLNKGKSSKEILNSNDSTFRSPIINTRIEVTKDMFGNIILDIDNYNYFKKVI